MNAPIIDPLQGDFPEMIEEYLEHGIMKCIAFNRRGTLLAAGCADGTCIIWDFETRGIAKELRDKNCNAAITSVCWSKYGHRVLVSTSDKSLMIWDVLSGEKVAHTTVGPTVLQARLHPGSTTPSLCLACPFSSAPMVIDVVEGTTKILPVLVSELNNGVALNSRSKIPEGSTTYSLSTACFNKFGDLVYTGNSKGEILIIDHRKVQVQAVVSVSPGPIIRNIVFSRDGQYLLTNTSDRMLRIYENLLPMKDAHKVLDELHRTIDEQDEVEKLKTAGTKCLSLVHEFQDSINRIQWKAPCFSGDGEWIISGSASRGEHKIYIWDRAGHLVKILEGPKEALIDLAWHPVHPLIVSVSVTGLVYIWAKDYTENLSAFAPDFKELEENEEYVEREDEFDLMPETEKVKESDVNEDDPIDILRVEDDSAFSDSDMSQDELCFLPAVPCPEAPEQQEKCVGSCSKVPDSNQSESPLSVEAGQNGHAANNASSPPEAMVNSTAGETEGTRLKRKRKPSEKGLELQAEKTKKPSIPTKPSGRLSRSRKYAADPESSNGVNGDYASDD
ncbi:hypothetical protein SAY87_027735 [Trapa incisa]|uniref:Protein RBL n=1 Tax=Trapa incisa TaxID=236973 RepID=A0AAN7PKH5_9MYRT|nr:hypothetical protein SAY87_027735 [Trapa incisa]